ncbi:MAG: beta-aspartyl-peptidase [Tissierellia bacterium]|nr:beta-aspartyl-peptidase [Tissierellia bacterium]
MRLEIGNVFIKDVVFGDETKFADGVVTVKKQDIIDLVMEDDHIKSVDMDVAHPGEKTRITPVKDVVEPRVKVEGPGGVFPGVLSNVEQVGSGKTNVAKGMAVMTTGKIVGFQEGIIDMCGPGADYTPFSKTINLVIKVEPIDGLKQHEHEKAVRFAGFKTAALVAETIKDVTPDEIKVYEVETLFEGVRKYPDLPKIGYVQMIQTQGLLHDTYVYGVDGKQIIPTLLYPTECMDGAIVSGNCVSACDKNTTYHQMNNPVVHDLLERHGKDYNFVGIIVTNENVYLADKERSSNMTAKLAEFLELDGVIISQEGFGNPDTDLIMNCKKIEKKGIHTVIVTDEYAGRDGASQSLADADPLANAVVTGGNANEVIVLPAMDKIIGTLDFVDTIAGGFDGSLSEDGSITVELQAITGATNEVGFNKMSARTL